MRRDDAGHRENTPAGKHDGELEQLMRITEDSELRKILGGTASAANTADIQTLRTIWKKEKNRIAAKKSREKKAVLMMELEKKGGAMAGEIEGLKKLLAEYDGVMESLLRYIRCVVGADHLQAHENVHNRMGAGPADEREMHRKLLHCLECFYHIRNGRGYQQASMARQDSSNQLINEIIYSIKSIDDFSKKK